MTVWVVRGGEDLKFLPSFESEDVVGIGWSDLPVSPVGLSRQELAGILRAAYPDASPNTIANNTGQVWRLPRSGATDRRQEPQTGEPQTRDQRNRESGSRLADG